MRLVGILVVAIVLGVLGVFAFAPFNLWPLAFVSVAGLLWLSRRATAKAAYLGAFCWAMGFFVVGVSWLNVSIHQFGGASLEVAYLLVVLLAAYLALYPLLFVFLLRRFQVQSALVVAALWTLTEGLRGWIFTGFPWLQFGYTQINSPFWGLAPIVGVTGLTFFVLWGTATFYNLFIQAREQHFKFATINALVLCAVGVLAAFAGRLQFVEKVPERALTITLAQGNIEQNLKWDPEYFYATLDIYQKLIAENLGKTDLIILPESALPTLENAIVPFLSSLNEAATRAHTEIMLGTVYQDEAQQKLFNSIINLGAPNAPYSLDTKNRYEKHHLVPFGEYVPLEELLRPLNSVFNLPMSAFQSGAAVQPSFLAKERKFAPAICYEIIFGEQVRQNLKKDTDFLLTISNDAWFGDSIGPWQHLQMAQMRALELGKPLIRATNTGISVFIDEQGKILSQAPQFVETTLTQKIAPTQGSTPYAMFGNWPLYALAAFFVLMHSAFACLRQRLNHFKAQ